MPAAAPSAAFSGSCSANRTSLLSPNRTWRRAVEQQQGPGGWADASTTGGGTQSGTNGSPTPSPRLQLSRLTLRARPVAACGSWSPQPSSTPAPAAALPSAAGRLRALAGVQPAPAAPELPPARAGCRQNPGKLSAPASSGLLHTSGGERGEAAPGGDCCCCWGGVALGTLASALWAAGQGGRAGSRCVGGCAWCYGATCNTSRNVARGLLFADGLPHVHCNYRGAAGLGRPPGRHARTPPPPPPPPWCKGLTFVIARRSGAACAPRRPAAMRALAGAKARRGLLCGGAEPQRAGRLRRVPAQVAEQRPNLAGGAGARAHAGSGMSGMSGVSDMSGQQPPAAGHACSVRWRSGRHAAAVHSRA